MSERLDALERRVLELEARMRASSSDRHGGRPAREGPVRDGRGGDDGIEAMDDQAVFDEFYRRSIRMSLRNMRKLEAEPSDTSPLSRFGFPIVICAFVIGIVFHNLAR